MASTGVTTGGQNNGTGAMLSTPLLRCDAESFAPVGIDWESSYCSPYLHPFATTMQSGAAEILHVNTVACVKAIRGVEGNVVQLQEVPNELCLLILKSSRG